MKKIFRIPAVCITAATIVLAAASCKNENDNNTTDNSTVSVSEKSAEISRTEADESSELSDNAKPTSLKELFEIKEYKSQLNSILDSLSDERLTAKMFLVDDKTIAFDYTFKEYIEDTDLCVQELESQLKTAKETLTDFVKQLEEALDKDGISLVLRYNNSDGETIYERTFTSTDEINDDTSDNNDSSAKESSVDDIEFFDNETDTDIDIDVSSLSEMKSATLEDLISQSYVQEMINSQLESDSSRGIVSDIYVENGNVLVYEQTYSFIPTAEQIAQLEEENEEMSSTYEYLASIVQQFVEEQEIGVKIRLKDSNGNIFMEQSYGQQ